MSSVVCYTCGDKFIPIIKHGVCTECNLNYCGCTKNKYYQCEYCRSILLNSGRLFCDCVQKKYRKYELTLCALVSSCMDYINNRCCTCGLIRVYIKCDKCEQIYCEKCKTEYWKCYSCSELSKITFHESGYRLPCEVKKNIL